MHPQGLGHFRAVGSFCDPLVECATCHRRYRLDELPGTEALTVADLSDPTVIERLHLVCPNDGGRCRRPRQFNLMFQTYMGPVEDEAAIVYLRPETAQGSYVNFKNVRESSRKKLPFGIAQIGKSFRNEISPGNFVFRMREFEQMEMQYFVRPAAPGARPPSPTGCPGGVVREAYGVTPSRLRLREHARTSWPTTPRRRSTSSTASRSAGRSWRAFTTGATSTCPGTPPRPARTSSTSIRPRRSTSSRGSWKRPPAPTGLPSPS